jgi:hypothetical protein
MSAIDRVTDAELAAELERRAAEQAARAAEQEARAAAQDAARHEAEGLAAALMTTLDAIRSDLLAWCSVETLYERYQRAVQEYSVAVGQVIAAHPSLIVYRADNVVNRHPLAKAVTLLQQVCAP